MSSEHKPLSAAELIGAALYDFAARLTTRRKPITLSAKHNAAPAAEAVAKFLADRGIDPDREFPVNEWQNLLSMLQPPAESPRVCDESECCHVKNSADATTQCLEYQATIARLVADLERLSQPPTDAAVLEAVGRCCSPQEYDLNDNLLLVDKAALLTLLPRLLSMLQPPADAAVLEAVGEK